MQYTTEQAKSIFDLIRWVSPYAVPFLLSLIIPLIWVLFRFMLGLNSPQAPSNVPQRPVFTSDPWGYIKYPFKYEPKVWDKIVFSVCFIGFFFGLIMLKIGEHHEMITRQKGLALKAYFRNINQLNVNPTAIPKNITSNEALDDILDTYPQQFIKIDNLVWCVDSTVVKEYRQRNEPLVGMFIDNLLQQSSEVDVHDLWNHDNSLQNLFITDMVFDYLGSKPGKYYIFTDSQNKIKIKKLPVTGASDTAPKQEGQKPNTTVKP